MRAPRMLVCCSVALLVLAATAPSAAKTKKPKGPKTTAAVAPATPRTYATSCLGARSCDAFAAGDVLYLVRRADGTIVRLDPRQDKVQSLGSVGSQPGAVGLAYLDNAVWVLSSDADPAKAALTKIDVKTARPGPPTEVRTDSREQTLVAAGSKLWFATVEGTPGPNEPFPTGIPGLQFSGARFTARLASMTPSTRAPTPGVDLGHGAVQDAGFAVIGIPLAASRTVVWAALGVDQGVLDTPGFWGVIVPMDAATGELGAAIEVKPTMVNAGTLTPVVQVVGVSYSFGFQSISATPDAVFALYRDVGGAVGRGVLVRVDAATRQATAVIVGATLGFKDDSVVSLAGGGAVWINDSGHTLRVDPTTGAVTGCIPGAIVAVGERYRWSVDPASGAVTATPTATPVGPC